MLRRLIPALVGLALSGGVLAWALEPLGGTRAVPGSGRFPHWQALSMPTDAPIKWLAALSPRLAAVDQEGTLWILEIAPGAIRVLGRYGEVASPEAPPVPVRLGAERHAVAQIARDGRLLLWDAATLRGFDIGGALSTATGPARVAFPGQDWDELLAIGPDGAVLLIGGLAGAPRAISRADVAALPDARITVGDLDGDGAAEAIVLSEETDRYPHGVLGDAVEARSVAVLGVSAHGLWLRAQHRAPEPSVFEDLVPVLVSVEPSRRGIVLARSAVGQGAAVTMLGWGDGRLLSLAESAPIGRGNRWTHVIGGADLSGDGLPEIVAVRTPHIGGVLTAYARRASALVEVAQTAGYSSHAIGSRNLEQALIADLDGNGRPEVVLPRQTRTTLAGVELRSDRFVERWALDLKGPIQSNLLAADLDGDGRLDLAVADRGGLRVFLSAR